MHLPRSSRTRLRAFAIVVSLQTLLFASPATAANLPAGFQMAQWGMTVEELKSRIRNLTEDVDRFQQDVTVFSSYSFPNNGFSEFRFFRGKLFYIRVKLTNKAANLQMYNSFVSRHGEPLAKDELDGAKRYLWEDSRTSMALYVYPYHAELRIKSVDLANELAQVQKKQEDYDRYLDEMMSRNFSDDSLTPEEKQRLLELKKGLSGTK